MALGEDQADRASLIELHGCGGAVGAIVRRGGRRCGASLQIARAKRLRVRLKQYLHHLR